MSAPTVSSVSLIREAVRCHVCSSLEQDLYLEARGYRVVRCRECSLWYVNPQPSPDELGHFYERYDDGEQWRGGEEHFNRCVRDAILRYKRKGAVLDVGCGSGNFLLCMREAGFSAFGIEPSQTGSDYARSMHGIETFCGMVEDYQAVNRSRRFDVVTLLNVLEHLPRPTLTLQRLRQSMARDGLLVAVVPDARFHAVLGRLRQGFGFRDPFWLERPTSLLSGFKLPDHLCSFQPRTISLLLEHWGFKVEEMYNAPVVFNPQVYRNLGKILLRSMFQLLYRLTLRRFLFGYSTLVVARKAPHPDDDADQSAD